MHHQPAGELCDVRQTETKGLGIFAKVDIRAEAVISDEVIIKICIGGHKFSAATWEDPKFMGDFRNYAAADVEQAMADLLSYYEDDAFQISLLSRLLSSVAASSSPAGGLTKNAELMLKNCLTTSASSPPFWIFFGPTTCTFNHSCIPNASFVGYFVDDEPNKLRSQVVALKPIKANSEITLSYRIFHLPTAERRTQIREVFRFDCVCDVCIDDSLDMQESDLKLYTLNSQIGVAPEHEIKRRAPWRFFKAAHELADEYVKLGIKDTRLPHLWENCASVAAYHSDAIRTHLFYLYAAFDWKNVQPSNEQRCNEFAVFPETCPGWGHTRIGLSQMDDVPQFKSQEAEIPERMLMVNHIEESYDRIMPKKEAEQKRQMEEQATLAEREKLADKADRADKIAKELLAEEEAEKSKKPTPAPAPKAKKKMMRKRKEKKAVTGGEGKMEIARGAASAAPELRLNTAEVEEEVAGWEVVGRMKGSKQQTKVTPAKVVGWNK